MIKKRRIATGWSSCVRGKRRNHCPTICARSSQNSDCRNHHPMLCAKSPNKSDVSKSSDSESDDFELTQWRSDTFFEMSTVKQCHTRMVLPSLAPIAWFQFLHCSESAACWASCLVLHQLEWSVNPIANATLTDAARCVSESMLCTQRRRTEARKLWLKPCFEFLQFLWKPQWGLKGNEWGEHLSFFENWSLQSYKNCHKPWALCHPQTKTEWTCSHVECSAWIL